MPTKDKNTPNREQHLDGNNNSEEFALGRKHYKVEQLKDKIILNTDYLNTFLTRIDLT